MYHLKVPDRDSCNTDQENSKILIHLTNNKYLINTVLSERK